MSGTDAGTGPGSPRIEACVTSVAEAVAAARAGADRLELCVSLDVDGLTPPAPLTRDVLHAVRIPVVAMIRPRPGPHRMTPADLSRMEAEMRALREVGVDGFVAGALTAEGTIDRDAIVRIVRAAGDRPLTFHKAFDDVADPIEALDVLVDLGVARLLTSGRRGAAIDSTDLLRRLVERADGRVEVMAGGRVRGEHLSRLVRESKVPWVHARAEAIPALVAARGSGSGAGAGAPAAGPPPMPPPPRPGSLPGALPKGRPLATYDDEGPLARLARRLTAAPVEPLPPEELREKLRPTGVGRVGNLVVGATFLAIAIAVVGGMGVGVSGGALLRAAVAALSGLAGIHYLRRAALPKPRIDWDDDALYDRTSIFGTELRIPWSDIREVETSRVSAVVRLRLEDDATVLDRMGPGQRIRLALLRLRGIHGIEITPNFMPVDWRELGGTLEELLLAAELRDERAAITPSASSSASASDPAVPPP